ncbi:MAG: protease complex subunit PrcB family protein [Sphingobacteriales bacterium]|nr:MAG: protease complex subunit PrcB family protein [Sphingobacteriales bacterium]
MKSAFISMIVYCCFLLFACANQNPTSNDNNSTPTPEKQNQAQKVTWTELYKGGMSAVEQPKQLVVTNQDAYSTLWAETFGYVINPVPEIPKVDFSQNVVVAAFMGQVNTGGHEIKVKSVEQTDGETTVKLLYRTPAQNCPVTDAQENPCLFFSLPTNLTGSNKVDIQVESETYHCD